MEANSRKRKLWFKNDCGENEFQMRKKEKWVEDGYSLKPRSNLFLFFVFSNKIREYIPLIKILCDNENN